MAPRRTAIRSYSYPHSSVAPYAPTELHEKGVPHIGHALFFTHSRHLVIHQVLRGINHRKPHALHAVPHRFGLLVLLIAERIKALLATW